MAARALWGSIRPKISGFQRGFSTANPSGVVKKLYRCEDIHGDTKLSGLLVEGIMNQKVNFSDEEIDSEMEGKKAVYRVFTRTVEDGRLIGGCNVYAVDKGGSSVEPEKRKFLFSKVHVRTATGTTRIDNCVVHFDDDDVGEQWMQCE